MGGGGGAAAGAGVFPPAAAIANVGPAFLVPDIRFFRSSNDNPLASVSFFPVNSLIND